MAIISHSHNFIFLHCRKTAGTSIEKSLSRYLGEEDVINTSSDNEPVEHPIFRTRNKTTRFGRTESILKKTIIKLSEIGVISKPEWVLLDGSHVKAKKVKERFEEVWDDYYKFCVIRNTYDRVVSQWRWMVNNPGNKVYREDMDLGSFLEHSREMLKDGYSSWYTYTIKDKPVMDGYIRFKNLKEDLNKILRNSLGLDFDGWIPKEKSSARSDRTYEVEERHIREIESIHKKEIEHWSFVVPKEL